MAGHGSYHTPSLMSKCQGFGSDMPIVALTSPDSQLWPVWRACSSFGQRPIQPSRSLKAPGGTSFCTVFIQFICWQGPLSNCVMLFRRTFYMKKTFALWSSEVIKSRGQRTADHPPDRLRFRSGWLGSVGSSELIHLRRPGSLMGTPQAHWSSTRFLHPDITTNSTPRLPILGKIKHFPKLHAKQVDESRSNLAESHQVVTSLNRVLNSTLISSLGRHIARFPTTLVAWSSIHPSSTRRVKLPGEGSAYFNPLLFPDGHQLQTVFVNYRDSPFTSIHDLAALKP